MNTPDNREWSDKHLQKMEGAFLFFEARFAQPTTKRKAHTLVEEVLLERGFGFESRRVLKERIFDPKFLKKIPIVWPHLKKDVRTIVTTAEKVEPVEVAMAFFDKGYLCFHTALYWNNETDQVPVNFFVASERKTPSKLPLKTEIDEFSLQEAFMKPPRETKKVGIFGKYRFALVEREYSGFLGVSEKKVRLSGKRLTVRHTDLARTLLDVAMHPHRAGGIMNVIEAFRTTTGKRSVVEKMIHYYKKLAPAYPYWQRIGFLFKIAGHPKAENAWITQFGTPGGLFFLDRPYKVDWPVDPTWKVAYPPGIRT